MYCKLVETFQVASECKTAAYFGRSLVHPLKKWSEVVQPLEYNSIVKQLFIDQDLKL